MKKGYTHIAMILDRSYSMHSIMNDTIEGYNKFIEDQKLVPGHATVTLVKFDHEYDLVNNFAKLDNVNKLTTENFVPRGGTALYDAIGFTINVLSEKIKLMNDEDRPERTIICMLTDGEENKSSEFSSEDIKSLIEDKEKEGWEFVFLGANQDSILTAKKMGISVDNSISYASNAVGTRSVFDTISKKYADSRTSGNKGALCFSSGDRIEQLSYGANVDSVTKNLDIDLIK